MVLALTIVFASLLSVDPQDNDGRTAAMMAAQGGKLDCLKYLVENKADVDAKVRGVLGEFGAGVLFDVWPGSVPRVPLTTALSRSLCLRNVCIYMFACVALRFVDHHHCLRCDGVGIDYCLFFSPLR